MIRRRYFTHACYAAVPAQEEVYAEAEPCVTSLMDGYNVCLMAYGQTGSGKTHTMQGYGVTCSLSVSCMLRSMSDLCSHQCTSISRSSEAPGLVPRILADVFSQAGTAAKDGWSMTARLSVIEIYNEVVRAGLSTASVPSLSLHHLSTCSACTNSHTVNEGLCNVGYFALCSKLYCLQRHSTSRLMICWHRRIPTIPSSSWRRTRPE
jgi:kinesin motor protein